MKMPIKITDNTVITAYSLLLCDNVSATEIVCALNILETVPKSRIKIADLVDMSKIFFLIDVNKK